MSDEPARTFAYLCENLCAEVVIQAQRADYDLVHCPNCGRVMSRQYPETPERPRR